MLFAQFLLTNQGPLSSATQYWWHAFGSGLSQAYIILETLFGV